MRCLCFAHDSRSLLAAAVAAVCAGPAACVGVAPDGLTGATGSGGQGGAAGGVAPNAGGPPRTGAPARDAGAKAPNDEDDPPPEDDDDGPAPDGGARPDGGGDGGVAPAAGCDEPRKLLLVDRGPTCSPQARPPPIRMGKSAGCGKPAPAAGRQTIEVCTGKTREYLLRLPAGYDPSKAYPLVFSFHHAYGYAEKALTYGGLDKLLADKAILVAPQALSPPSKPCFTTWSRNFRDDLALFDALFDRIAATACVDLGRVYATGLSSGGFFSASLGCQRGDVVRGVMPVAGGLRDFTSCRGGVGALIVYQAKDQALRDAYVKLNGCDRAQAPTASPPDPKICVAHQGCRPGTPVTSCVYGHAWPSWATPAFWSFMSALP